MGGVGAWVGGWLGSGQTAKVENIRTDRTEAPIVQSALEWHTCQVSKSIFLWLGARASST